MIPTLLIAATTHDIADSDDLHENKWVAITVTVVVLSLAIWKLIWPAIQSMQANNIFKKERVSHYGKPEKTGKYKRFSPIQGVVLSFLFNIAGIALYTYHHFFDTPELNSHNTQYDPGSLFGMSLLFVVALFIYTFIDESEFDMLRDFKYAVKVWLTTISASPIILLLIYNNHLNGVSAVALYFGLIIMVHGAGVAAYGTLVLAVNYFSRKTWAISKKRSYIFLSARLHCCHQCLFWP